MPLLPASLIEPLWVELAALIGSDERPEFDPTHLVAARANDHDSPLLEPTLAGTPPTFRSRTSGPTWSWVTVLTGACGLAVALVVGLVTVNGGARLVDQQDVRFVVQEAAGEVRGDLLRAVLAGGDLASRS